MAPSKKNTVSKAASASNGDPNLLRNHYKPDVSNKNPEHCVFIEIIDDFYPPTWRFAEDALD